MIKSVDKALMVLEYLEKVQESSLVKLSGDLGLQPSNACRILATLRSRRFVRQKPGNGHYALGLRVLEMGNSIREGLSIREEARPVLRDLADETGETAFLAVLDQNEAVYIEKAEGDSQLVFMNRIGKRASLHCTGVGKALLSGLSSSDVRKMLSKRGMDAYTPTTITDVRVLMEQLQEIRTRGYAVDNEECEIGVKCVAGPVYDSTGAVVAAVSASGPSSRFAGPRLKHLIGSVLEASSRLSLLLGAQIPKGRVGELP